MSTPSSPAGGGSKPLQPVSHNEQRDAAIFSPHRRTDSSVHEKIHQFNTLAMQAKQQERKTFDAALKRAQIGREEAEAEMRRYRDEARMLRKQVEEGKDRERRIAERLEAVMENYAKAKETHAHTQQLWEKEVRRAKKEAFKAQSALLHFQEDAKTARTAQKTAEEAQKAAEEALQTEKERSRSFEQQAEEAQQKVLETEKRLADVQEELAKAQERIRSLEQEVEALRDQLKAQEDTINAMRASTSSKKSRRRSDVDDEPEAPRKRARHSYESDSEVENIQMMWQWEKKRADRAQEQIAFLEAECHLKMCSAAKTLRQRTGHFIVDASDKMILSENTTVFMPKPTPGRSKTDMLRRSTMFSPAKEAREVAPYRTLSQVEAETEARGRESISSKADTSPTASTGSMPVTPKDDDPLFRRSPSMEPSKGAVPPKERTSLLSLLDAPVRQEDPAPLFNIPTIPAPDPNEQPQESESFPLVGIPKIPVLAPRTSTESEPEHESKQVSKPESESKPAPSQHASDHPNGGQQARKPHPRDLSIPARETYPPVPLTDPFPSTANTGLSASTASCSVHDAPYARPHTTAAYYPSASASSAYANPLLKTSAITAHVATTKVPLKEETSDPSLAQRLLKIQRTPVRPTADGAKVWEDPDKKPIFDPTNPALTPTMTREQALQCIRERRDRARSVGREKEEKEKKLAAQPMRKVSGSSVVSNASAASGKASVGSNTSSVGERGRSREREVGARQVSDPTAAAKPAVSKVREVSAIRRVRT